jgi:hypothetical protein
MVLKLMEQLGGKWLRYNTGFGEKCVLEREKKEEQRQVEARRSRSMITHQAKARMLSVTPHLALVTDDDDPCLLRAGRVVVRTCPCLAV